MANTPLVHRPSGAAGGNTLEVESGGQITIKSGGAIVAQDGATVTGFGGSTLDGAYDYGGAGAGKAVTVDSGAIALTNSAANDNGILTITKSPAGAQAGAAVVITMGAQATGNAITLANSGSGSDIYGSGGTWTISKVGAAVLTTLSSTAHTLLEGADPAGTVCYITRDDDGDVHINALTGKTVNLRIAGTDVVTVAGAAITLAQATTISAGGLTIDAGGLTVSAGGAAITGTVTITGSLTVTEAMTWGATLTVDELILDSDGVAPAGTFAYVVSDNTGDLTLNALTGKEVHVAINGNDEFDFNATALQMASGNNLQFLGDNGILDSAGNEVLMVTAVGSAVNYLNVRNAATANPIILECLGTADKGFQFHNDQSESILNLTPVATALYCLDVYSGASGDVPTIKTAGAVDIGITFETSESEEILELTPVASALYNIKIISAASGGKPTIQSSGANDIGIDFETTESEEILSLIPVATAVTYVTITSAATGVAPTIGSAGENDIGIKFCNAEGEPMLVLASAATAVDYVQIASAAAAGKPIISVQGAADIGLAFHNDQAEEILTLTPIATGVDYIDIKSGDGTTMPTISTAGDTAAVDLILAPKATGAVVLNNGTDPVVLKFMGAQAGYNNEIQDVNGNEIIALQGVATAVCEIGITNATTGNPATVKAQGETNSNLMLDTTGDGTITLAIGGDEVIRIFDAAAMTFAAAANTAGHAVYIQTEDGGADGGAGTGRAGALLHISTGDGSASATATAVGGAGGALSVVSGAGAAGNTTGNGGVGGAVAITAGAGGASGAGAGVGGTGGSITLTAGAGGGAGGGTAGAPGCIVIGAGVVKFKVQTIDMASGAVTLTLVPGTPAGTLLTGNILAVDANSDGTENLLLPPEADCNGLMLIINNTGGESIMVQNDAGDALLTLETANSAYLACDGTTWRGTVGVP